MVEAGGRPVRRAHCATIPNLHLIAVVPRHPDVDGRLALPPNQVGRRQAIETCRRAGPDRVHVFDVENHEGTPVYVHAKVCVDRRRVGVVGSDNFNRRSWTHDSELSCAVLDDTTVSSPATSGCGCCASISTGAADGSEDDGLDRPDTAVGEIVAAARRWRTGTHPVAAARGRRAGCVRTMPERPGLLTRLWAVPAYRMIYDPDGRSYRDRLRRRL